MKHSELKKILVGLLAEMGLCNDLTLSVAEYKHITARAARRYNSLQELFDGHAEDKNLADMKKLKIEDVTFKTVSLSAFGCRNCLWYSCECKNGHKFEPHIAGNQPSCKAYTYYD